MYFVNAAAQEGDVSLLILQLETGEGDDGGMRGYEEVAEDQNWAAIQEIGN